MITREGYFKANITIKELRESFNFALEGSLTDLEDGDKNDPSFIGVTSVPFDEHKLAVYQSSEGYLFTSPKKGVLNYETLLFILARLKMFTPEQKRELLYNATSMLPADRTLYYPLTGNKWIVIMEDCSSVTLVNPVQADVLKKLASLCKRAAEQKNGTWHFNSCQPEFYSYLGNVIANDMLPPSPPIAPQTIEQELMEKALLKQAFPNCLKNFESQIQFRINRPGLYELCSPSPDGPKDVYKFKYILEQISKAGAFSLETIAPLNELAQREYAPNAELDLLHCELRPWRVQLQSQYDSIVRNKFVFA